MTNCPYCKNEVESGVIARPTIPRFWYDSSVSYGGPWTYKVRCSTCKIDIDFFDCLEGEK